MNAELLKPFMSEDAKEAIFQMGPLKAPGPVGYRAYFYQTHVYKAITKMLANRETLILPDIAFAPRRLISDNIMAAYETLHTMKTQLSGRQGYMALKLDMSKAYNRVEWDCLASILSKLGFADQWVDLVLTCINSSSFSVMVNGVPFQWFFLQSGLRQGYSLSPYLFILCAEALSSQLTSTMQQCYLVCL
ncbi:secreted RxLR effector protein 78-like [Carya illinoinensis]|uniref:secreted RxLR effector protein 78-like n=1 Tax=Carya illinoinensis TaxID=32201 RepID=UPI001C725B59|nr:secreted RxLR effector protein 78-like [Carya illinoinensis]